jgi:hypothetical protein
LKAVAEYLEEGEAVASLRSSPAGCAVCRSPEYAPSGLASAKKPTLGPRRNCMNQFAAPPALSASVVICRGTIELHPPVAFRFGACRRTLAMEEEASAAGGTQTQAVRCGPAVRRNRHPSICRLASCIYESGLASERLVLRPTMDISAPAFSLVDRSQIRHQDYEVGGKTDPPSPFHSLV